MAKLRLEMNSTLIENITAAVDIYLNDVLIGDFVELTETLTWYEYDVTIPAGANTIKVDLSRGVANDNNSDGDYIDPEDDVTITYIPRIDYSVDDTNYIRIEPPYYDRGQIFSINDAASHSVDIRLDLDPSIDNGTLTRAEAEALHKDNIIAGTNPGFTAINNNTMAQFTPPVKEIRGVDELRNTFTFTV